MKRALNLFKLAVLLSLVLLIFFMKFASANTLVGGKVYNSDFSQIIKDAEITVNCGGEILNTVSLSDGSYAVVFDKENCYNAMDVHVSAYKGNLSDKEDAIINSQEGEFMAIANLNLVYSEIITGSNSKKRHSLNIFICGNGVCDSGETLNTCSKDCLETTEEEELEEIINEMTPNSNSDFNNNSEEQETQNTNDEITNADITGKVIGNGKFENKFNIILVLIVLILVLMIGTVISALIKRKREVIYTQ